MPLTLHAEAKKRLIEVTSEFISNARVDGGKYLCPKSFAAADALDKSLPRTHASIGLIGAVGEEPLSAFVTDHITATLSGREFDSSKEEPLTKLAGFEDPESAARGLIEHFETLPWDYDFLTATPLSSALLQRMGGVFQLHTNLKLYLPQQNLGEYEFPESRGYAAILDETLRRRRVPKEWIADRSYCVYRGKGYESEYGSAISQDFRSEVKSLFGLLLVVELCKYRRPALLFRGPHATHRYRLTATGAEPLSLGWFETDESEAIESIAPLDSNEAAALSDDLLRAELAAIRAVFTNRNDRILNAARWYFDSYVGTNQLLSFVQAMVCLEILFGDRASSEKAGITTLISNRCAYSMRTAPSARAALIGEIESIYDTRSRIVHSGHANLSLDEQGQLRRLRIICRASLASEIALHSREA